VLLVMTPIGSSVAPAAAAPPEPLVSARTLFESPQLARSAGSDRVHAGNGDVLLGGVEPTGAARGTGARLHSRKEGAPWCQRPHERRRAGIVRGRAGQAVDGLLWYTRCDGRGDSNPLEDRPARLPRQRSRWRRSVCSWRSLQRRGPSLVVETG
jgi:hypothetical protein